MREIDSYETYRSFFSDYFVHHRLTLARFHRRHSKVIGIDSIKRTFAKSRSAKIHTAKQSMSPERLAELLHAMGVTTDDAKKLLLLKIINDSPLSAPDRESRFARMMAEVLKDYKEFAAKKENVETITLGRLCDDILHLLPDQTKKNAQKQIAKILINSLQRYPNLVGVQKLLSQLQAY